MRIVKSLVCNRVWYSMVCIIALLCFLLISDLKANVPTDFISKSPQNQSIDASHSLQQSALDPHLSEKLRWAAIQKLARIDFNKNRSFLVQLTDHSEWFVRNAALLAIGQCSDRDLRMNIAKKLLKDPALVVRSAAVDELRALRDERSWKDLLEAFYSPENIHKGQSLWIRPQIASALVGIAKPGHEAVFLEILQDRDDRVRAAAIRGLERLTSNSFGPYGDLETAKKWIAWGQAQDQQL